MVSLGAHSLDMVCMAKHILQHLCMTGGTDHDHTEIYSSDLAL